MKRIEISKGLLAVVVCTMIGLLSIGVSSCKESEPEVPVLPDEPQTPSEPNDPDNPENPESPGDEDGKDDPEERLPLKDININEFDGYRFAGLVGGAQIKYNRQSGSETNIIVVSDIFKIGSDAQLSIISNGYWDEGEGKIEFTPYGFIKKIELDVCHGYVGSSTHTGYRNSGEWEFNYDDAGHLTGWRCNGKETNSFDRSYELFSTREEITRVTEASLTWQDGNLVAINIEYNEEGVRETGQDYWDKTYFSSSGNANYNIRYGEEANPQRQFPLSLTYLSTNRKEFAYMGPIGLWGIGPNFIPVEIVGHDFEGNEISWQNGIKLGSLDGVSCIMEDYFNNQNVVYKYVR